MLKQIGLGVSLAAIDTVHTAGSAMTTNVVTDLRIDGDGFFAVKASLDQVDAPYLTRAGNFTIDANRNLVNAEGFMLWVLMVLDQLYIPEDIVSFSIAQNGDIIGVNANGEHG